MKNDKLTKEEIVKIFSLYVGQQCLVDIGILEISAVDIHGKRIWFNNHGISNKSLLKSQEWNNVFYDLDHCKLILKPLSHLSDEHLNEMTFIYDRVIVNKTDQNPFNSDLKKGIENLVKTSYQLFQQLLNWGYAVPLFFSKNHPCNGKNAIELGIAYASNDSIFDPFVEDQ